MAKFATVHPGEVLHEEFLAPMGLTADVLAELCHVPRTRIESIVAKQIGVSADTALRLGAVFGNTPEFWLNLQLRHDLEIVKAAIADELDTISALR